LWWFTYRSTLSIFSTPSLSRIVLDFESIRFRALKLSVIYDLDISSSKT